MGKVKKGLMLIIVYLLFVNNIVKADVVIDIIIPDEIKKVEEVEKTQTTIKLNEMEKLALQKIAIAEAIGEGVESMAYVMQTVLNRMYSNDFPNTILEVIEQKGQFSTYPKKYNKAIPCVESEQALLLLETLDNKEQLYFENTVPGSWQSTHKEFVFKLGKLSFYK